MEMEIGVRLPEKYRGTVEYQLVYAELIAAARHKGTVTYKEVARIMGLPLSGNYMASETGNMLGEISFEESSRNRPLLSALVVSPDKGKPGKGFFTFARSIGKLKEGDDEEGFWEDQLSDVYAIWDTRRGRTTPKDGLTTRGGSK